MCLLHHIPENDKPQVYIVSQEKMMGQNILVSVKRGRDLCLILSIILTWVLSLYRISFLRR